MNDKPKDKWLYELNKRLDSMPKEFKPEVNNVSQVAGEEIWLDIDKI